MGKASTAPALTARMPELDGKGRARALDRIAQGRPAAARLGIHDAEGGLPIAARMIRRAALREDEACAALRAPTQIVDSSRGWPTILREADLHRRHDEAIAQGDAAKRQRREER